MFTATPRIQRLQALIEKDGFSQSAHFMLGEEYRRDGRAMEAAAKFRRVVELNPDHAEAWHLMAESFEQAGVAKEAAAAFDTAARQYARAGSPTKAEAMRAAAQRIRA